MASPALEPGDLIGGKYRIERELGRGGMGLVFLAIDTELEREVAIKVLLEEHTEDQASVQRFLREARASVKIKSEHVAHVYETGKLPSSVPYIVMEYLQGEDLGERIERDGAMSVARVTSYILQACEALAEAHAAGIVHRDLKPANLFLSRHADGSDVVKILDFGISKISTSSILTKSQTLVGSPFYMSPEQLESAQDVDARADIWALGVIMYELSTGQRPFDGTSLAALCVTVLNGTPAPLSEHLSDVPPGFEEVVMRCLKKKREQRFQNVGQLAEALEALRPESTSGTAARVTRVLQNARTVPDTPRRESDSVNERVQSWAQTNNSSDQRQKQRRLWLSALVLTGAAGVGVGLGQWVQPAPEAASFGQAPEVGPSPPAEPKPTLSSSAPVVKPTASEELATVEPSAPPSAATAVPSEASRARLVPHTSQPPKPSSRVQQPLAPKATAAEESPETDVAKNPFLRRH